MSRTLGAADSPMRTLAPTTTAKLAARMLAAASVLAEHPAHAIFCSPALDILLALHAAEETATYPTVSEILPVRSMSRDVAGRWLGVLVDKGLVHRRADILALSDEGYAAITELLTRIFDAQRALDAAEGGNR